jgi:hypothetical protein
MGAPDGRRQLDRLLVRKVVKRQHLAYVGVGQSARRWFFEPGTLGREHLARVPENPHPPLIVPTNVNVGRVDGDDCGARLVASAPARWFLLSHAALLPITLTGTSAADAAGPNLSPALIAVKVRSSRHQSTPDLASGTP